MKTLAVGSNISFDSAGGSDTCYNDDKQKKKHWLVEGYLELQRGVLLVVFPFFFLCSLWCSVNVARGAFCFQ